MDLLLRVNEAVSFDESELLTWPRVCNSSSQPLIDDLCPRFSRINRVSEADLAGDKDGSSDIRLNAEVSVS
jgi:hypothetical protein